MTKDILQSLIRDEQRITSPVKPYDPKEGKAAEVSLAMALGIIFLIGFISVPLVLVQEHQEADAAERAPLIAEIESCRAKGGQAITHVSEIRYGQFVESLQACIPPFEEVWSMTPSDYGERTVK